MAYLSYRSNTKNQQEEKQTAKDKEIIEQAILSLEWAYDTLGVNTPYDLPPASRLNWLTSSRHILRFYSLKKKLKTETYKLICEEKEEYWRHKFYVLLSHPELINKHYYMNKSDQEWPENIELTSAMVVNDFSNWPKHTVDPLESIDRESFIENKNPFMGACGRGIKSYLNEINDAKQKYEQKQHNKR